MGTLRKKMIFIMTSIIVGVLFLLASYFVLIQTGVIQARQTKLVIVASSHDKVYDGTPLECNGYEITYGKIRDDHKIEVTYYGSQTDAGMSQSSVVAHITDSDGVDVTNKYEIEYVPGSLVVDKRYLKIKSGSSEKYYDGEPLKGGSSGFSIIMGSLVAGHSIAVEGVSEITKVGVTDNVISTKITDSEGVDATANYDIDYSYGTLTVISNEITIRSATIEKIYDGKPLKASDGYDADGNPPYIISEGSDMLKELKHTLMVETSGEITNVGSVPHEIIATIIDSKGNDVSNLYDIKLETGDIVVNPRPITVFSPSASKVYDAVPLRKLSFDVGDGYSIPQDIVSGHYVEATYSGAQTEVGESKNSFASCDILDASGEVVTGNYEITYEPGALTVTPINICVYSRSAVKQYDGTPLTCTDEPAITGGLLLGHRGEFEFLSSITYPGTIPNDVVCKIVDEYDNDVSGCYKVDYIDGTLTINSERKTIYVQTPSLTITYDGNSHKTEYEDIVVVDSSELLQGHFIEYLGDTALFQNVLMDDDGNILAYENQILENSWRIVDENGYDVSNQYNVLASEDNLGEVMIEPRLINVYTSSYTKTYDGVPFDAYQVAVGLSLVQNQPNLIVGHQIGGVKSVAPTDYLAGTYKNEASVIVFDQNGNEISQNYIANPSYLGSLVINKAKLNVTIEFATKTNQDGLDSNGVLTVDSDEWVVSGLVSNGENYDTLQTIKFTSLTQWDAGSGNDNAKVEVTDIVISNSIDTSVNVASCYEIIISDAYLYWI